MELNENTTYRVLARVIGRTSSHHGMVESGTVSGATCSRAQ